VLELLGVIGGQTRKDQHAQHRDGKAQTRHVEEHRDERGNDQAEQAHDQKAAHTRQALLRRVTHKAKTSKSAGSGKKVSAIEAPV
jgi:hypothetical protein